MDMAYDIDQGTIDTDQGNGVALATLSSPTDLAHLSRVEAQQVAALVQQSKKPNTQAAYQSDLRRVAAWLVKAQPALAAQVVKGDGAVQADGQDRPTLHGPLPLTAVLGYIVASQKLLRYPTLRRHLATLSAFHNLKHPAQPNPCTDALVRSAMSGLRRQQVKAGYKPKRAKALRREHLVQIIGTLQYEKTLAAKRDRALLLIGWAGALRRSELANLTWAQISSVEQGLELDLQGTKTDSGDDGQIVALPLQPSRWLCPVGALEAWKSACMAMGLDMSSPVFCPISQTDKPRLGRKLSGKAVGEIVKRRATLAGYDWDFFTAHSLRAGLITEAHEQGRNDLDIMATSRHRSPEVFATYVRSSDAMAKAASKGLL